MTRGLLTGLCHDQEPHGPHEWVDTVVTLWCPGRTPQEPGGAPEMPPGVQEVLESAGAALAGALAPLVAMVAERDELLSRMTYRLVDLQEHLAAVLPLARPTWAADLRIVEEATAALRGLTPKEDDGTPTDSPS